MASAEAARQAGEPRRRSAIIDVARYGRFRIAAAGAPRGSWRALAAIGVACAVLPDLDAVPTLFGRGDFAGLGAHRGITHSIVFALGIASVAATTTSRRSGVSGRRTFLLVALATLSHGALDAFSDFGRDVGVAFLAPFSAHRFTAPWQPIAGEFSELFVCLLPLTLIGLATLRLRKLSLGFQLRERPVQLGLETQENSKDERAI